MKTLLLFLLSLLFHTTYSFNLQAQNDLIPIPAQKDTLKIVSWNIYMLPAITRFSKEIGKAYKVPRAKAIAEVMKQQDYDIIVWQETFNNTARRMLKNQLKELYPYQYGPANHRKVTFVTNSGITIFSKFPLTYIDEIRYSECEGIDCWARKGALMLGGEWNGHPFQIIGTHLQAGGPDSIRAGQMKEIKHLLLRRYQKNGVPVFICGDMNTRRSKTATFNHMMDTFGVDNYKLAGQLQRTNSNSEIDYIFVRPNGATVKAIQKSKIFTRSWGKASDQNWLSDHYAVEAAIIFR